MKLQDWMNETETTAVQLSKLIGKSESTISRYLAGKVEPNGETLKLIHKVTLGAVTANDFFGMESKPETT